MIAFVQGIVADITGDGVILENNGVGYRIFTPAPVAARLVCGSSVRLYTYLNVREDAMHLYGFLTEDDRKVFMLLITVSGIGPKGGLAILSVMSANDLRYAVMAGDGKAIAKAPGVGLKTAQKVILELRDKLKLEDAFEAEAQAAGLTQGAAEGDRINESVMALAALGYSQTDAMKAVRKCQIQEDTTVEEILKMALKQMFQP